MQEMNFYNCLVKLGGEPILMESPRLHISEDEVKVLKSIHGPDAIRHLSKIGTEQIDRGTHLYQLARYYNNRKLIEDLFRVTLENFEGWLEESLLAEDQDRDERFQMQQIEKQGRKEATLSAHGSTIAAPEAQGVGVDPNVSNTTGIADAAKLLEASVAASEARDATSAKPAVQPTTSKKKSVD